MKFEYLQNITKLPQHSAGVREFILINQGVTFLS